MFIISEDNPLGYLAMQTKTDNIRDIYDIVLNITNDEEEALWALEAASDMGFGGQYERNKYKLEFDGGSFAIGTLNHYKEDGEEYSELESVVEGDNYDKGFFDFTLHINKVVDSKYSYLKGKTLVFHKE